MRVIQCDQCGETSDPNKIKYGWKHITIQSQEIRRIDETLPYAQNADLCSKECLEKWLLQAVRKV